MLVYMSEYTSIFYMQRFAERNELLHQVESGIFQIWQIKFMKSATDYLTAGFICHFFLFCDSLLCINFIFFFHVFSLFNNLSSSYIHSPSLSLHSLTPLVYAPPSGLLPLEEVQYDDIMKKKLSDSLNAYREMQSCIHPTSNQSSNITDMETNTDSGDVTPVQVMPHIKGRLDLNLFCTSLAFKLFLHLASSPFDLTTHPHSSILPPPSMEERDAQAIIRSFESGVYNWILFSAVRQTKDLIQRIFRWPVSFIGHEKISDPILRRKHLESQYPVLASPIWNDFASSLDIQHLSFGVKSEKGPRIVLEEEGEKEVYLLIGWFW